MPPIQKPKILGLNVVLATRAIYCNTESILKLNYAHILMGSKLPKCQTANCGPTRMHSSYICISGFILSPSSQM